MNIMVLFDPLIGDVLTIFVGVIGMLALVAAAYNWSMHVKNGKLIDEQQTEIEKLRLELRSLKEDIAAINRDVPQALKDGIEKNKQVDPVIADALKKSPADTPTEPRLMPQPKDANDELNEMLWQAFVEDFNRLAGSMDVPKAEEACAEFIKTHGLKMLVCIDHAAEFAGTTAPKFTTVDQLAASTYWAYNIEGDSYAVVPNPLVPYGERMHAEGGMKETFASNYKDGSYTSVIVKLPALFKNETGTWKIAQPGVIKVS